MNRRNFIGNLLAATAGFAIPPPATTYSRVWRAVHPPPCLILKPSMLSVWTEADRSFFCYASSYRTALNKAMNEHLG